MGHRQAVAVVLRFPDMHSDRLHESFFTLALEALGRAWPCKKPEQPAHKLNVEERNASEGK
jgi:hypothetical protein